VANTLRGERMRKAATPGALAYSLFRNGRRGWGRSLPRWVLGRRGRHGPVVGGNWPQWFRTL